ncbi:MAG TPA: hypothetical protein VHG31_03785, partial [Stellaceae bacterium]|nr:hypothetical protein [Stellaceae bacterium]
MLGRLRRFSFIDRFFKTIETYTSLTEQYPWIKWSVQWLFNFAVAAMLGEALNKSGLDGTTAAA